METRLRETYNRLNFIVCYKKKKMRIFEGNELYPKLEHLDRFHRSKTLCWELDGWFENLGLRGLDPYNGWIMATTEIGRVDVARNARTHTESTYISKTRRIERRHQLVMYMKDSICGMGYTCHVLTGCPIKRFGTSSRDPSFFRSLDTGRDSLYLANLNITEKIKESRCIQL